MLQFYSFLFATGSVQLKFSIFTVPFVLLLTDNSPGAEAEVETVESDHEGEPFNIETE